jgi:hypothetical protein
MHTNIQRTEEGRRQRSLPSCILHSGKEGKLSDKYKLYKLHGVLTLKDNQESDTENKAEHKTTLERGLKDEKLEA